MEKSKDAIIPLDYIEFQIFPSQNRYEACACQENTVETVTSSFLEPLLLHSPTIKALHSKGFDAKYKLIAPEDPSGVKWFTKSTLVRFLQVIGSSEVINATNAVKNEISQLEEARKFHLSLYSNGPHNHLESGKAGNFSDGNESTLNAGINSVSSDDSKNELLRAMDLRLTALRGELSTAFAQSARATCSNEEMDNLEKFSHHFGATDLRDSLSKLIELSQEKYPGDSQSPAKGDFQNTRISRKQENNQNSIQPPQPDTFVKYSASPAKAAQVERESSSESEESSCTSEEEQPSIERSRTLIRSASPRRSASPMRRVQIGRSGSRKSTALTIKSLNYFPRERLISQRDAATQSSDEEVSEQTSKRSESNVKRISVQDAISLFESKQRDQTVDIQKTSSLLNAKVGANKSVLRRWSAGAGENFSEDPQSTGSDNAVPLLENNLESGEMFRSLEENPKHDLSSEEDLIQDTEVGIKPDSPEQGLSTPAFIEEKAVCCQTAEASEKLTGSAEWTRQKEAELDQLLMKMMETKPVRYGIGAPDNGKSQNLLGEQKGGFSNHSKEKRIEKRRGETAGKQTEKEKQFSAVQQILERKAKMASANENDVGRKHNVKTQKPQKTSSQLANPKKEISRLSADKKASSKASTLPSTRKSWPSTSSPRSTGVSPAKTPPGMASGGATSIRKKSQPAPSVPRLIPKVERPQLKPKSVKLTQNDTSKSVKDANEKKQQQLKKTTKSVKPKVQSVDEDAASLAKPSFYSKVTKKSSVVPVESKPFLRKGSGIGSGVTPVSRTKVPPQPEVTLMVAGDAKQAEGNIMVSTSSDQVIQQQEVKLETKKEHVNMESDTQVDQEKCENLATPIADDFTEGDGSQQMADSTLNTKSAEESDISPTAWVEIEEQEEQVAPGSDSVCQIESPHNVEPVGIPNPRVRHSLSQMLLEESSEPDIIEWGNAENPPALVYQKDAPKGLKRLLKFARKSKTDTSSTGWSSPSAFSEGEDDTEESKFVTSKRNSDNLLKKATLQAKNLGHPKTSSLDKNPAAHGTFAPVNTSKTIAHRLSEKLQEGQTSTKATRSFFSLSAFKGGKQNETKFQ